MATMAREPSFINNFFYAIADIIRGIREVIASIVYGPEIIKTFYPEYNRDPEHISIPTNTQEQNHQNKTFEKFAHEASRAEAVQPEQSTQNPPPSKNDKNKNTSFPIRETPTNAPADLPDNDPNITETRSSYNSPQTIAPYTLGFYVPDDIILGVGCAPITEMDRTEFANTLESEIREELRMNPDFGFVEIGGRIFTYDNNISESNGASIITINDNTTGFNIATFEQTMTTDDDGNRQISVELSDMNIDLINEWPALSMDANLNNENVPPDISEPLLNIPFPSEYQDFNYDEIQPITTEDDFPPKETVSIDELIKLAEKGDMKSFALATQDYDAKALSSAKSEIEIYQYTATVGVVRNNFENAMNALEWQAQNIGCLYEPPAEDAVSRFSTPEPDKNDNIDEWEY